MKTREQQLEFCKICQRRKFMNSKGLVCSLTNEWAEFEDECEHFEVDEQAEDRMKERNQIRKEEDRILETGGLSHIGIKNGGIAGAILMLGGLIWLLLGIYRLNRIFVFSFLPITTGLGVTISWYVKWRSARKKAAFIQRNQDVLDIDEKESE